MITTITSPAGLRPWTATARGATGSHVTAVLQLAQAPGATHRDTRRSVLVDAEDTARGVIVTTWGWS